jgi:CRISPR-associated protein Cas8a1/Csx13
MAKQSKQTPIATEAAHSSHLVLRLFAPGMSPLHRAGLGGLAATLRSIDQAAKSGAIKDDDLPGNPWQDGTCPWHVDPQEIRLEFGKSEAAAEFLLRLFRLAFRIDHGLIHLPGQYPQPVPPISVRVHLQLGMLLTFLQHGKSRDLAKGETVYSYQPEDDGKPPIELRYRDCSWYKHQNGWKDLVDEKTGRLTRKPIEIAGPMNPGAMVRHNAFAAQTKLEESPEMIISLYFALIGCLALSVNRGVGVLIVPEVSDLMEFARLRPFMTPRTDLECQITSAGDAALQADIRLQAQAHIMNHDLPGCQAATFRPTPWASQQKSRVHAMNISPGCDIHLERFAVAMDELKPRLIQRTTKETVVVNGKKQKVERPESFWAASVVRPLVADNLAQARAWYRGFVELMTKIDAANKRPVRDKLFFDRKGLHKMIENPQMWQDRGESSVVHAVHESLRRRFGKIADENKGNPGTMKNRMKSERERWRLAFAGAKTPAQFRFALCDLFSRAGISHVLQTEWQGLLPMLSDQRWQLTRDLALLGMASYAGKGAKEADETDAETGDA